MEGEEKIVSNLTPPPPPIGNLEIYRLSLSCSLHTIGSLHGRPHRTGESMKLLKLGLLAVQDETKLIVAVITVTMVTSFNHFPKQSIHTIFGNRKRQQRSILGMVQRFNAVFSHSSTHYEFTNQLSLFSFPVFLCAIFLLLFLYSGM